MAFDPNVYDEVTVQESVTAELPDALGISVYDTVSVTDSVVMGGITRRISVYESVAVTEYLKTFSLRIYTDPRPDRNPRWPVWELEASTQTVLRFHQHMPGRTIEAHSGANLKSTRIPVRSLEGSGESHPLLTLDSTMPTYSLTGYLGARLNKIIPCCRFEGTFVDFVIVRLEKTAPGWEIDAAMIIEVDLRVSSRIPRWKVAATLSSEDTASVNKRIPYWTVTSTLLAGLDMETDGKVPVRAIDASVYSDGMILDTNIPIRDLSDASAADRSRFTGIVL